MKSNPNPPFCNILAVTALCTTVLATTALANPPVPRLAWETPGFSSPESVAYDARRGVLYVSNMNQGNEGGGFISRLAPDGKLLEQRWVEGLLEPRGLDIQADILYIGDREALVEINLPEGTKRAQHPVSEPGFLNDVTVAADGSVYLSDMMRDVIYRLRGGQLIPWLETPGLESPNGLLAETGRLLIGAWGVRTGGGFETTIPGHLKSVDYSGQGLGSLGDGSAQGNLDGIEPAQGGGYYVTDWMVGSLLYIDAQGQATELLDLEQGSADLEYIPELDLLLIPMMKNGTVRAYDASP